jgi:hypothetical protein
VRRKDALKEEREPRIFESLLSLPRVFHQHDVTGMNATAEGELFAVRGPVKCEQVHTLKMRNRVR